MTVAAPPMNPLQLDAQFCFPVYAANNLIQRAYRSLLQPLGLTYPQYLVLLVLWEQEHAVEGITVTALGERLLLDSGTLSPLLQRLQAKKLVKKRADVDDGRRVHISLTAKGRALRAEALKVPEALVCRLLPGSIDAATLQGLEATRAQLRAMITALDGVDLAASDTANDPTPRAPARARRKKEQP